MIQKHYEEFAVKNAYPLIRTNKDIRRRMPTRERAKGKYPDRDWFWGLCFTCKPHWAHVYYKKVMDHRIKIY